MTGVAPTRVRRRARLGRRAGPSNSSVVLRLVITLVLAAVAVLTCRSTDIPLPAAGRFLAVEVALNVLPGVLVWRALRVRAMSLWVDVPCGTGVGHAVSLAAYFLLRWCGVPLLVWAVPLLIVAPFVLVPKLRWVWRPARDDAATTAYSLGVSAVLAFAFVWFARFQAWNPVSLPDEIHQSTDHPYLLSLAAELKHHFPPRVPFVTGEPLYYHWFFFGDAASASWATGLELDLLVFRLLPIWYLLMTVAAFAAVARVISNSQAVGLLAVAVTAGVSLTTPLGWVSDTNVWVVGANLLSIYNWAPSPTQAFALLLSMPLVLLVAEVVRVPPGRVPRGRLALVMLLSLVVMGAKAVFIPVLVAGVLLALAHAALRSRRLQAPTLLIVLVLVVELAFAQLVLFGGETRGAAVGAGGTFLPFTQAFGFGASNTRQLPWFYSGAVIFVAWVGPVVAALGLLTKRPKPDSAVAFLAGMCIASLAAALLLTHPGLSQLKFLRAAMPWGALLGAWGAVVLVKSAGGSTRRLFVGVGAALVAGAMLAVLNRHGVQDTDPSVAVLVGPYLAAAVCVVVIAGLCAVGGRERRAHPLAASILVAYALLLGCGLVSTAVMWRSDVVRVASTGEPPVPVGGIPAARYLRDASTTSDLVATNAHCRIRPEEACDHRNHWIAAWTERRVLVEGWAYTTTANRGGRSMGEVVKGPFWDLPLLEANDELFTRPNRSTRDRLAAIARVDWLVVDTRFPADLPGLDSLFPQHRRFGDVVVYRVS